MYYEAYCSKKDASIREKRLKMHAVKHELNERIKFSLGVSSSAVERFPDRSRRTATRGAASSLVERFPDKKEVLGSIPRQPTSGQAR